MEAANIGPNHESPWLYTSYVFFWNEKDTVWKIIKLIGSPITLPLALIADFLNNPDAITQKIYPTDQNTRKWINYGIAGGDPIDEHILFGTMWGKKSFFK